MAGRVPGALPVLTFRKLIHREVACPSSHTLYWERRSLNSGSLIAASTHLNFGLCWLTPMAGSWLLFEVFCSLNFYYNLVSFSFSHADFSSSAQTLEDMISQGLVQDPPLASRSHVCLLLSICTASIFHINSRNSLQSSYSTNHSYSAAKWP